MPKHLRLIARLANTGVIALLALGALVILGRGNFGGADFLAFITALLSFNLYLIEKSVMPLSEEKWLKSEVRKVFLRRKLARLTKEGSADADGR